MLQIQWLLLKPFSMWSKARRVSASGGRRNVKSPLASLLLSNAFTIVFSLPSSLWIFWEAFYGYCITAWKWLAWFSANIATGFAGSLVIGRRCYSLSTDPVTHFGHRVALLLFAEAERVEIPVSWKCRMINAAIGHECPTHHNGNHKNLFRCKSTQRSIPVLTRDCSFLGSSPSADSNRVDRNRRWRKSLRDPRGKVRLERTHQCE